MRFKGWRGASIAAIGLAALASAGLMEPRSADAGDEVDTALIVSVDVSNSVDAQRYRLQMDGIAAALEDKAVISAILGGGRGAILFSMVQWADKPVLSLPWVRIATVADAQSVAARVRRLPRHDGEFTCMSRMMRFVADKMTPTVPVKAARLVMDVSGDGIDNCNAEETTAALRDELVGYGMTINGLPIVEGGQTPATVTAPSGAAVAAPKTGGDHDPQALEPWYRANVMGGPGAFVLRADGYADFGRAIRQKFVVEVSDARIRPK